MSKVIYKLPLEEPSETFAIPVGSKILCVRTQRGLPTLWVLTTPHGEGASAMERRTFRTVLTGEHFDPEGLEYIGTFQLHGGSFVGHVFEEKG